MYEHEFQWQSIYGGGKRHALIVPGEGYELLGLCCIARQAGETYNPPRPGDEHRPKCKACLGIIDGSINPDQLWDNPRRLEELPAMHQHTRILNRASRIDAQIEALEAERLRLLSLPEDLYEEGDVVSFTKQFGRDGTIYNYAALKHNQQWYLTQRGDRHSRRDGFDCMSWEQLLEFVGDGELWAATEWEQIQ